MFETFSCELKPKALEKQRGQEKETKANTSVEFIYGEFCGVFGGLWLM